MSQELKDIKSDKARQVFDNIVKGLAIHIEIREYWYRMPWDTQGNHLVSFATKVALKKGDPTDRGDTYFRNLSLLMKKAPKRSDITSCSKERKGHCITHITAKHSPSQEHTDRVKRLFKSHHPGESWNKKAGNLNYRGMVAGNYARNKNEGTRELFSKQIIPKSRVQKMAREHGLTNSNMKRMAQNFTHKVAVHGRPSTWNNSVLRSFGARVGGGNNGKTGTTRHTTKSGTTGNTKSTANTGNTASSGRSKSTSPARRTSPTFDALPPTTQNFIRSLLELPANEVKNILKGMKDEDRKKITAIWKQVLQELRGNQK